MNKQLRLSDEERWLSSRYAPDDKRPALIALYLFNHELARIRTAVSEPGLAAIRFQWWRDILDPETKPADNVPDIVPAIREVLDLKDIDLFSLIELVDQHEAAIEANDRSLEPEARLARMAARVLAPVHGWGPEISKLAPHYGALRRGEAVGYGPVVSPAPKDVRPAVAHFRLRWLSDRERPAGPLLRRWIILKAVLSGKV